MSSVSGRIAHRGVTNPVAPQSLVVQNAVLFPNLLNTRSQEPRPTFPLLNGPMDLAVRRGEWGFTLKDNKRAYFTHRPNQDDLAVFTAAGGMTGHEPVMFVGRIDTPDEVSASGDQFAHAELGCVVRRCGPASGTNTGPAFIPAGAKVYWDWPEVLRGADGRKQPRMHVKGNQTKWFFSTKTLQPGSALTYVLGVFHELLVETLEFMIQSEEGGGKDLKSVNIPEIIRAAQKKHCLFENTPDHQDFFLRLAAFIDQLGPLEGAGFEAAMDQLFAKNHDIFDAFRTEVIYGIQSSHMALDDIVPQADPVSLRTSKPHKLAALYFMEKDDATKAEYYAQPTDSAEIAAGKLMKRSQTEFFIEAVLNLLWIPHIMTEVQALIDSRYMGVALSASSAGNQLDLLLG